MTDRICTREGCTRTPNARGLCSTHYSQWIRPIRRDPAAWAQLKADEAARKVAQRAWDDWDVKPCSKCGDVQAKSEFSPSPASRDGLHSWCKACLRALASKNYDTERARAKHEGRKSDAAYRAMRKAAYDRWRREHPERMAAATSRWRETRREHVRATNRAWTEANREAVRIKKRGYNRAREARKSGAGVDYAAILAEHGMTCHICGDPIASRTDLHFDHVIPLAKGGEHAAENIRPSHAVCNLRKGARIA